ncbi:MAG TPA: LapA family protein [Firmicutes bacterium]|nr:LapA family protein [Bacillota bacterium]
MAVYLIAALVFGLSVATFAVQNSSSVLVRFLGWQAETSLVIIMLASAAAGAILMGVASGIHQIRLSIRLRQSEARRRRLETDADEMQRELDRLERELERLRREAQVTTRQVAVNSWQEDSK